ncbi:MAG: hypothetical protein AAGE52_40010 [Myxococcota bacterium]
MARFLFRRVDLFERDPRQVRLWAGVEVEAKFLFREEREETIEVPASTYTGQRPPDPTTFLATPISYSWIRRTDGARNPCTSCSFSPGKQLCLACGGTGLFDEVGQRCFSCRGTGATTCAMCNGERFCSTASIVFIRDHTEHLERQLWFPIGSRWSRAASNLRAHLLQRPPDEELRVSLRQGAALNPYRGGPSSAPTFHGINYGDAMERAQQTLALRQRMRPLMAEVQAYARPILEVVYRVLGKVFRVLIVTDPTHGPAVFVDQ